MAASTLSFPAAKTPAKPADEFRLLCECAVPGRSSLSGPAPEDYKGVHWDRFLQLAEHHGVLALVARNLSNAAKVPAEVISFLRSAYATNLRRNLSFTAELARILGHFSRTGVRALSYKGPVLAQAAYGDLGCRTFNDLDLLIPPADYERAKQALGEIGYQPSDELPPAVERLFLRTGYERAFDGAAGKNLVELQWNLLPYFYAVDFKAGEFRVKDLLARAASIKLDAAEVPCLSPEDSLLVLCLHAAKHLWTRLIWIVDILKTLQARDLDFALVAARAQAMGITRILGVSCWLAQELAGTELDSAALPPAAQDLCARDSEVCVIGEECLSRLSRAATYDFESTDYFRWIWKLRERPRDRWRYLWRLARTPGVGEIAAIRLPEILFPLYRVVRIGRLLCKLA